MKRIEEAVDVFKSGRSCSIAILSAYGPQFGLDKLTAIKIALPFGAGMGRRGETCGAVTGALMVLGLAADLKTDKEQLKEKTYAAVLDFLKEFERRNGSISCKELVGCDLLSPDGKKKFREQDMLNTRCMKFVRDAAEILESVIAR